MPILFASLLLFLVVNRFHKFVKALGVQAVSKFFADFHAFRVDQEIGQKLVVCMGGNHAVQAQVVSTGLNKKLLAWCGGVAVLSV